MTTPYPATLRGKRVMVVCDWSNLHGATPSAVIEYGDPVDAGAGIAWRRAVVPLSELTRCEDASKTG